LKAVEVFDTHSKNVLRIGNENQTNTCRVIAEAMRDIKYPDWQEEINKTIEEKFT
jgi:hypothetical protein